TSWTIPKGRPEPNETPTITALREFKEESGIDLTPYQDQLVYLGVEVYKTKSKQIHAFLLKTDQEFPEPKCTSMVTDKPGEPFPELDAFKWVTYEEALLAVFDSQKQLM